MGDVARMLERLDLEQIDPNRFQGASPQEGRKQVFGGQVAAQALAAAARTVRGRLAHSLHGYFLRRGDPTQPIFYDVDRIRDGRSFTTRRVVAEQGGKAIFSLAASFQTEEAGYSHQAEMPAAPMPHTVPPNEERLLTAIEQTGDPMLRFLARLERPIAIHDLDPQDPRNPHVRSEPHLVWMRARDPLPDDAATHQCVLTFASDMTLLGASLLFCHGVGPVVMHPCSRLSAPVLMRKVTRDVSEN